MLRDVLRRLAISHKWPDDAGLFRSPSSQPYGSIDATQRRILDYITSQPGVHLRQICRELGLAMGDVQYHVHRLERDGLVTSVRRGLYRFFYPAALFGERQKDILGMLSLDTPRELLMSIVEAPGQGQDELARAISVTQPTVSWHLRRLVDLGIVERQQSGRSVTYRVAGTKAAEIASFVRSYHPTVWETWSSRLADIFISYSGGEGEETRR
ncbi:MAG: winged helix-turn-helix transcriptional regulator [Nitrososphaerota archaeon]|jgi:DNA-binding MarR family transcriptional regulator|nr:winged helix-turn-helix transcriptional regulator [Nitrososphaerota archaeon]